VSGRKVWFEMKIITENRCTEQEVKEEEHTEARKPRSRTVRHTVRASDGGLISLRLTRKSAIAAQCTECMGDDHPINCTAYLCPLWPFRAKTLATRFSSVSASRETTSKEDNEDRVTQPVSTGPSFAEAEPVANEIIETEEVRLNAGSSPVEKRKYNEEL
jgi:hypothetical protein